MSTPRIHLFWDNSNIFHSAQRYAERIESYAIRNSVRIHFMNLYKLALAGRQMASGVAVGSVPPEQEHLWDSFTKGTTIKPELYERGAISKKEQGVDQCLQTHMLRAVTDEKEPQIAVLLTGDGQGYDDGVGFHADLERMYKAGWGIEVISWDLACKGTLKRWASSIGSYIQLESYYNSVTFVEGGRGIIPLSLTSRQKSSIGGSPEYKADLARVASEAIKTETLHKLERQNEELESMLAKAKADKEKAEEKAKYLKRVAHTAKKKKRR
ncbi:NYN domain-containing protein [Desulfovibrio sp. DV]|uniref:NYN domain-containing protein n=1 Tax=Desulfovibrio sp. DV TaxID=1844708 RepID=UPI000AC9CEA1|nr:NYN domain-containing protein [Desulfovibrio sp. DV]